MGNRIDSFYSHQLKQAIIDTLNETLGTSISDDIKDIEDDYSVYDFQKEVREKITPIQRKMGENSFANVSSS